MGCGRSKSVEVPARAAQRDSIELERVEENKEVSSEGPPGSYSIRPLHGGPPVDFDSVSARPAIEGLMHRDPVTLRGGGKYTGQWRERTKQGEGILENPDGSQYTGQFVDDVAQGYGVLSDAHGNKWEGCFEGGKLQGQGVFHHSTGAVYTGKLENGVKHDTAGKEVWADGTVYIGPFLEGEKTGEGALTYPTHDCFKGQLLHDQMHGKGTYTWMDGRKYEGEWVEGIMEGEGMFVWPTGSQFIRYTGTYRGGVRTGVGFLEYSDGRSYRGQFKNNQLHGKGTETWPSKFARSGEWRDNVLWRWSDEAQETILDTTEETETASPLALFSNPLQYAPEKNERVQKEIPEGLIHFGEKREKVDKKGETHLQNSEDPPLSSPPRLADGEQK